MEVAAWIVAGLVLFLLLVILLVLLSLKGNKDSEEILRKQSVVIVELTEEIKVLEGKVEECCAKKVAAAPVKAAPAKKAVAKKAPAKKAPVKKETVKKAPAKKAPVKNEISKEEQAKRDAKRKAAQEKLAKSTGGKKITAADLKKLDLTDIYGVGPKIKDYYIKNGIKDISMLAKVAKTKINEEKFYTNLPALKSFTPAMKKDKILSNKEEAAHMIELLTK